MNPYTHQPLAANDSIRVLELQPGQSHDTLKARLLEVRLSNKPTFSALSYCWGAPQFDTLLECDGEALYITNSLAAALNHLRNDTKPLIIWIDQVCINQRDSSERSCQVQLMSRMPIYRSFSARLPSFVNDRGLKEPGLCKKLFSPGPSRALFAGMQVSHGQHCVSN
jgi:hypothetical protein